MNPGKDRPAHFADSQKFAEFRVAVQKGVREAVEGLGLEKDVFFHVAGGEATFAGATLRVEVYPIVDGVPQTRERAAFLANLAKLEERGLRQSDLGVGILSPSRRVMGWLAGYDEETGTIVVEENDSFATWVGVPPEEIASRLRRFGAEHPARRFGGRIA